MPCNRVWLESWPILLHNYSFTLTGMLAHGPRRCSTHPWPSTKASFLAPASCGKFDAFPFHFFAICVFSFWQRLFSLKRKPEKARKWKINQVNGNIQSVSSNNRATQMAKPSAPPTQTYLSLPFPYLQTQFSRKSKCYDFSFF